MTTARIHDRIRGTPSHAFLSVLLAGSIVAVFALAGCPGRSPHIDDGGVVEPKPKPPDDDHFPDHTVKSLADRAAFDALSAPATGSTSALFIITSYPDDDARDVRFLDAHFYQLHDEWYWFRLLNGAHVPGLDDEPVTGLHFESIPEIYTWAHAQDQLPLDLRFIGERLYSPRFYDLALFVPPKQLGLGTLMHFDARPDAGRDEVWAWQLEYDDAVSAGDIAIFFDRLEDRIPSDIWQKLKWVVRSPAQEAVAEQMEASHAPYFDRIIRYQDLTVPGDVQVYSAGLTAGRLRVFRRGDPGINDTAASDIVVVEDTPDNLPQCSGFITASPQTALAHVSVLAKARGIPNVYVGGILDDPNLAQLAQVRAPVVLRAVAATATAPAHVDLVPMTEQQFATYRALTTTPPESVPQRDFSAMPYVEDLESPSLADQDELRLVLGGKSVGLVGLLDVPGVEVPDHALGISVRGYHEHIASMLPQLQAMLAEPAFQQSAVVRFLVLEGEDSYRAAFPTPADERFEQQFLDEHPVGDTLGDIVRAGGVQGMITAKPMDPATLQTYLDALTAAYGDYADTEGLRFRSSSQVEDSEDFQGAGVGLSFTGFLHADRLPSSSSHHDQTIERAIKGVWATYWRAEGFEERRLANIDQLSANMGITVHARSDNWAELANGDLFITLDPPDFDDAFTLELDVQPGFDPSVTNPNGSSDLPEHDVVHARRDGSTVIDRVQAATLSPDAPVLSDDELSFILEKMSAVAQYYFDVENAGVEAAKQRRTITLDVELRKMAAGWPQLLSGTNPQPERILFRQAASVFPSLAGVPSTVQDEPIPLDVLSHAQRVEQRSCTSPALTLSTLEVYTNPLVPPDLGFAAAPFTAQVVVTLPGGARVSADHTAFTSQAHPGMADGGAWDLDVEVAPGNGFTRATWGADGSTHVEGDAGVVDEPAGSATCTRSVLYATPEDFLEDIIASQ